MAEMYRQGDLLFKRVDEMPKESRKRQGNLILEGEATGHSHRVKNGGLLWEAPRFAWDEPDHLYVEVIEPEAPIVHEEHGTIVLPHGIFEVIRQREFGETSQGFGTRFVMD